MAANEDGVGFSVEGLTIEQSYTGIIRFRAASNAPAVAAAIDNKIFGATSSIKDEVSEVRVNFLASRETHFLSLNPMTLPREGPVWIVGYALIESDFAGNLFTGATPSRIDPGVDSGSITLAGMMVQVLPTGTVPREGGFISGQGNAGCEFEDIPTDTPYNAILGSDGRVGMSAKLIETGPWL